MGGGRPRRPGRFARRCAEVLELIDRDLAVGARREVRCKDVLEARCDYPAGAGVFERQRALDARRGRAASDQEQVLAREEALRGAGPFIVMELVEGESLETLLKRKQEFAPQEAARICQEVLAGLEAAHAAGIIQRDVKPANVLLTRQGTVEIAVAQAGTQARAFELDQIPEFWDGVRSVEALVKKGALDEAKAAVSELRRAFPGAARVNALAGQVGALMEEYVRLVGAARRGASEGKPTEAEAQARAAQKVWPGGHEHGALLEAASSKLAELAALLDAGRGHLAAGRWEATGAAAAAALQTAPFCRRRDPRP